MYTNWDIRDIFSGALPWKGNELPPQHMSYSQAYCRVNQEEMTAMFGNVLMFWQKRQGFLTLVDS